MVLKEVRRGTTYRSVSYFSFDPSSKFLVACTESEKIHIFSVGAKQTGGMASWLMPSQLKDEYALSWFSMESAACGPEALVALINAERDYMHVLSKKDRYCKVMVSSQGGELKTVDQTECLLQY